MRMLVTHSDVERFASWSGDRNPLHVDPDFARKTFFGRPVVHGALASIEALTSITSPPSTRLAGLEIEFRGAIFPGVEYDVEITNGDAAATAFVRDQGNTLLSVRCTFGTHPIALDTSLQARADAHGASHPLRTVPVDRSAADLAPGSECVGVYPPPAHSEAYARGPLGATEARILGLCSYLVGMELPGLRSLFTSVVLQFHAPGPAAALVYRLRAIHFDAKFRILSCELQVADLSGRLIASGEIRSYVPYSPAVTDLNALARTLAPETSSLTGKVALVCGGSRGLGADIAAALALGGCHVYVAYRTSSDAASELAERVAVRGGIVNLLPGDVGDPAWCAATLEAILSRHSQLDVLVLSACSQPSSLSLVSERFDQYLAENLRLVRTPLTRFLPALEASSGALVAVSSSTVESPPPNWAHYVAVKQILEGLVRSAASEYRSVSYVIPRPAELQTSWNDTPTRVVNAIPAARVAARLVNWLATEATAGKVAVLSEFPPLAAPPSGRSEAADFRLVLAAGFTAEPLLPAFGFWFKELGLNAQVETAAYGQVIQELLNPTSLLASNSRGAGAILLRVQDWLRELPDEVVASSASVVEHLERCADELVNALRAYCGRASTETILVICPSPAASPEVGPAIRRIESRLLGGLEGVAGLQCVLAEAFHGHFEIDAGTIADPLRDEMAHIPYRDPYLHTLATLVVRHLFRRLAPPRKVVVVDCDNTLWCGVVGEVGAAGVVLDVHHRALHETLVRLAASGVLICLCSKNEESDVWTVFDTREDFGFKRETVVASMINWRPKSENLRVLAERLNLGLDSFIFIDDNPVECADVQAGCPGVLTLLWPHDPYRALRLLRHTWELDAAATTAEDSRRTQQYREEFLRQELKHEALTFRDFIESLNLEVEVTTLIADDVARAAQLTQRTNQFNFTTIRRNDGELRSLLNQPNGICATVRVRDRFGDYGLVGLLLAESQENVLLVDTFLLSCRVLGRGVEHRLAAELGKMAIGRGLDQVRLLVRRTERNQPAWEFVKSIVPANQCRTDEETLQCDVPAAWLAEVRFEPGDEVQSTADGESSAAKSPVISTSSAQLHARARQIDRAAYELGTATELSLAIRGSTSDALSAGAVTHEDADVETAVFETFSRALRLPQDVLRRDDRLEALGCDSFKIVEITVALIELFPWLPSTLLFECHSIGEIVRHIGELSRARVALPVASEVGRAAVPSHRSADTRCDIAVVGLNVRCAGAGSPEDLWELLNSGRSAIVPVPADRKYFFGRLEDSRPHWAGLLDGIDEFDAEFFGISPREAEFMDPQLRLLLEVAWGALEDAGLAGDRREPETGVYIGALYSDYVFAANLAAEETQAPYRCWENFSLANRLSHALGLRGPSLAINTACSASGTALHLACTALAAGECQTAIVGGVNLILDPNRFPQLGRLGILSPTGRCQAFGAEADGTVLGEGAGIVVLRPLQEAVRRGDRIYGVIKGTALSSGTGTVGFTAPNPEAQADAIRAAIRAAGVDPRTISLVETHGTGTALGDPIEIRGLELAYSDRRLWDAEISGSHRCRVASIKPNIGHLEAGAGVVGLIKVLLQLDRRRLVPSLTSAELNPQIPFDRLPFLVQREGEVWERPRMQRNGMPTEIPRRAALSSFGVGGANVHIVVEEAPEGAARPNPVRRPLSLLTLSARSESALDGLIGRLHEHLRLHPHLDFADVCFSMNVGRKHFEHRCALLASDRDDAIRVLESLPRGGTPARCARAVARPSDRPKIAFLFTGQGSQSAGMGRALYDSHPVFRKALKRCAEVLNPLLDRPLLDVLFATDSGPDAALIHQTGYTQPALFAIEYALFELWSSWGVRPDAVLGHSVGEITALCASGALDLQDGARLIAARGRLMQALPAGGAMCSIQADEEQVRGAIQECGRGVSIAAINGPRHIVISGRADDVEQVTSAFRTRGIKTKALHVSHAFHSELMDPMLPEFESVASSIRMRTPDVPIASCVSGRMLDPEQATCDYWRRQVRDSVRFTDALQTLHGQGTTAYVEIGPNPVLAGMGRLCVPGENILWLPSLRSGEENYQTILGSLAQLYCRGASIDWSRTDAPFGPRMVSVPASPLRRRRCWISLPAEARLRIACGNLTGEDSASAEKSGPAAYEVAWRAHQVLGLPRVNGSAGTWIIFADETGVGAALAGALRAMGAVCILVRQGEGFTRGADGHFTIGSPRADELMAIWAASAAEGGAIRGVVFLWGISAPRTAAASSLHSLLAVLQAMENRPADSAHIWVVTRGAIVTGLEEANEPTSVEQALLWGFGRVAALEFPERWGGLIDLPPAGSWDVDTVAARLLTDDPEDQLALRGGEWMVPRVAALEPLVPGSIEPDPGGVYLITGGLGALGMHVARWLASRGARRLVLTSRRGADAPHLSAEIARLREQDVQVEVVAADVSTADDVGNLFCRMHALDAPLRGVFHVAGQDELKSLREMSADAMDRILAPKVTGARLLDEATRGIPLDLFVCFSSFAAVFGSAGRAHYAAANSYLDALCHARRRAGLPALSINWGPWSGGGMASDAALEELAAFGNYGLQPSDALRALEDLLGGGKAQAIVAHVDWPRFRRVYEARRRRPLLAELGEDVGREVSDAGASGAGDDFAHRMGEASAEQRFELVLDVLRGEAARALGFSDPTELPVDASLFDIGMDSLRAVEFAIAVQKRTGLIQRAPVFDHPRLWDLAAKLLPALEGTSADGAEAKVAPADGFPSTHRRCAAALSNGIVDYSPPMESAVFEFVKSAWPERRQDLIAPRWRWMFVESAARCRKPPKAWLYQDDGRIVGHHGAIPVVVQVGGAERESVWFTDSMVLEAYRRQAVGTRLLVRSQQEFPFSLSLGQAQQMRQIQLGLGWRQVAPLEIWMLPLEPSRVLAGKLPRGVPARPAALALKSLRAGRRFFAGRSARDVGIVQVERFDARHDRLWADVRSDYPCAVVRDSSYLNWKYVEQPGQSFVRLEVMQNGLPRAVAVLMVREADEVYSYRRAFLVDLLVPISDTPLIFATLDAATRTARELNADALIVMLINSRLRQAVRAYGFMRRPVTRYLLVYPEGLPEEAREAALDAERWFITMGDSDIDRPW